MCYMGEWILASHWHKGNISHVMEQLHLLHEDAYNLCASNWCHMTYVSFVTQIEANVLSRSLSPMERISVSRFVLKDREVLSDCSFFNMTSGV